MTTTAVTAPVPVSRRLANAFWKRQLYKYPNTWPRLGYLAIVVLTTIMLYYLYYVEGAVTPLMLPYYHMSFQFFLYLLVVSNAIGAFSAFIGGLSDKIGRANLTIFGTLIVAVIQLFAIPQHPRQVLVRRVLLRDRLRRRRHPRLDPGADAGLLAADGPRRRHGLLGARAHDGRPVRQPGGDAHARPPQAVAGPVHHLGHRVHVRGGDLVLLLARALAAAARPADGQPRSERALVEARAMGIDVETATAHPLRSMLKLDLVASSIAISVFLLFYYASVSVLTIYWVVTFNRTTPQANGINVWLAGLPLPRPRRGRGAVGLGAGAQAVHARRGDLRHGDDGLPHRADRPPPHRLLLQRPGDRAAGRLHRARLRAVDGQLHRAGRVAQPRPDGDRARHLGLDPAHHRGPLLPRAAPT